MDLHLLRVKQEKPSTKTAKPQACDAAMPKNRRSGGRTLWLRGVSVLESWSCRQPKPVHQQWCHCQLWPGSARHVFRGWQGESNSWLHSHDCAFQSFRYGQTYMLFWSMNVMNPPETSMNRLRTVDTLHFYMSNFCRTRIIWFPTTIQLLALQKFIKWPSHPGRFWSQFSPLSTPN